MGVMISDDWKNAAVRLIAAQDQRWALLRQALKPATATADGLQAPDYESAEIGEAFVGLTMKTIRGELAVRALLAEYPEIGQPLDDLRHSGDVRV